jgi:predicted lipoprotein with Yx(FWY)xxD motif
MTPTGTKPESTTSGNRNSLQTLGFVAVAAALAAACGSSSSSSASGAAALQASAVASSQPGAGSTQTGGAAGAVTITTKSGPLGTYLVDGAGKTLYLWVADKSTTSTCSGQCATYWPPVTGPATASGGAQQSDLGTSKRSDGSMQVTYAGHPLYYFLQDKGPGQTTGQSNDGFGAKWWVVGADGKAITTGAPASGAASSSGAGVKGY